MEFGWTSEQLAFREQLRAFLDAEVPADFEMFDLPPDEQGRLSKHFAKKLAERRWLTPAWPAEYGGRAASPWEQVIVAEEMVLHGEPRALQYMNVNWIGPAIILAGTDEQRSYHLNRIGCGDVIWCQGFSEPDAGSDLAALQTRAERDGDEYVVNGEKIWTSSACVAEFCFLLVRTDPHAKKQEGITILLVPMETPGMEVRRIRAVVGESTFHHLVMTDMRVPVSCRLGDENRGWDIVRKALAFERVGVARYARAIQQLDRLASWGASTGRVDLRGNREVMARAHAACELARLLAYRAVSDRTHGRLDGASAYVYRAAVVRAERLVSEATARVMGDEGLVDGSIADHQLKWGLTAGVAAGTYEIQLNLIARLALGLPKG